MLLLCGGGLCFYLSRRGNAAVNNQPGLPQNNPNYPGYNQPFDNNYPADQFHDPI